MVAKVSLTTLFRIVLLSVICIAVAGVGREVVDGRAVAEVVGPHEGLRWLCARHIPADLLPANAHLVRDIFLFLEALLLILDGWRPSYLVEQFELVGLLLERRLLLGADLVQVCLVVCVISLRVRSQSLVVVFLSFSLLRRESTRVQHALGFTRDRT